MVQTLILVLNMEERQHGIQKQGHSLKDTRCGYPVPHEDKCVDLDLFVFMSPYVLAEPNPVS